MAASSLEDAVAEANQAFLKMLHLDQLAKSLEGVDAAEFFSTAASNFVDDFQGFVHAIDWHEPLIVAIVLFHFASLLAVVSFRKSANILFGMLVVLSSLSLGAEQINSLAATHWKLISQQNYFDRQGVFVSIMLSVPIVFNCFLIVIFVLRNAIDLMAKVHISKLKQQLREKGKKD